MRHGKKTAKQRALDDRLSRRERQIVAAVYRLGEASVAELVAQIPDPPTPDAIRRTCHILVEKGALIGHVISPRRKVYRPVLAAEDAKRNALEHLLDTFFGGSSRMLVGTLIDLRPDELTDEELDRLQRLVESGDDE